jgi:ABC-2 type transport system ATP-binding protein
VIEVQGLKKTFVRKSRLFRRQQDTVNAVSGLTFSIPKGEFVGFLGPNGAGKSTTIKMLTGILRPSAGDARVAGFSPAENRIALARKIGVVFGQRTQLWWDLPLADSFRILQAMYDISDSTYKRRLLDLTDLLDLSPFFETPVRQLSLGQRMRGELAGALIHQPEVLFLDEPTIGLDVTAKAAVRRFLKSLGQAYGTTMILTTHDMADVEALCGRMMVIDHGCMVFDGKPEALRDKVGIPSAMIVVFEETPVFSSFRQTGMTVAQGTDEATLYIEFDRTELTAAQVLDAVRRLGNPVDFSVQEPPLESVIHRLYDVGGEPVPNVE